MQAKEDGATANKSGQTTELCTYAYNSTVCLKIYMWQVRKQPTVR
jgi:hypothetical protein